MQNLKAWRRKLDLHSKPRLWWIPPLKNVGNFFFPWRNSIELPSYFLCPQKFKALFAHSFTLIFFNKIQLGKKEMYLRQLIFSTLCCSFSHPNKMRLFLLKRGSASGTQYTLKCQWKPCQIKFTHQALPLRSELHLHALHNRVFWIQAVISFIIVEGRCLAFLLHNAQWLLNFSRSINGYSFFPPGERQSFRNVTNPSYIYIFADLKKYKMFFFLGGD